jgi:hypothetical protein
LSIAEKFNLKGIRVPIEGNKPQILDDAGYVWLVGQGNISVFLTALSRDNEPGVKNFLFEAKEGDLLFGMTTLDDPERKILLASGIIGSSLIQLEVEQLCKLLAGESSADVIKPVRHWLEILAKVGNKGKDRNDEDFALQEIGFDQVYEYLNDSFYRENYHKQILLAASEIWEEQIKAERIRLREKERYDQRIMANSIAGLASIDRLDKTKRLEETSGDYLLDACRLIGQVQNIEIVSPPSDSFGSKSKTALDDIARASRVWIREVALNGEWYKQDAGPILGYMKEDGRPVALIPVSPTQYQLHDPALGVQKKVDKETAAGIKSFGFIFYRPLNEKKITLRDLLSFSYQSCWKRDIIMIALMGVLGGVLGTAIPLATGIVYSSVIPEGQKGQLLQIAFFLLASVLAAMIFQFIRSLATLRIEGKVDGTVQASIWDRLISLPVPFFQQFSAGELTMRAMGISKIRTILSGVTLNTILSGIFSVFTFALLFYYDTGLAWVAAGLAAAAVVVMAALGYLQMRQERKLLDITNNISGIMLQLIGAVTKFRVAGAERRAFYRWANKFKEQRQIAFKRMTLANWLTTFNAFFPILSSMIIFYTLISENDSLSPGQFIGFNSAFTTFMLAMISLSQSLTSANIVIPLYQRVKPILETLPEYDDTKINPKPLKGSIIVVDNCYGEFVEKKEPTEAGADIMAGSLIKNPGGGLALCGGYVAGKRELVNLASYRMTVPGLGREVGATIGQNRSLFQGFFMAPHTVAESLKGAVFASALFEELGYKTCPAYNEKRSDIIQAIFFEDADAVIAFCQGIQKGSPVDSFVRPEPSEMPGYDCPVVMAAGAFVQGSSIELSADAPIRPPYTAYLQGGLVYEHVKLGVLCAVQELINRKLLK